MKKRVLVIDDDEDILAILDILFEMEGYEVILSRKETTVEEIQILHPDIVLLDVVIRGSAKRGDEICRELKSEPSTKNIPVLLVSGEYEVAQLATKSGAEGYVAKPFNIEQIVNQVKAILG